MDSQTFINLVLLLSITPILLLVLIGIMYSKVKSQSTVIADLRIKLTQKEQKEKEKSFLKFYIGSKALLNDFGLEYTDSKTGKKTSFSVDYEVEIVDISEEQLKVKALSFSNDAWSRDPNHKQGIIDFMQDRWISKKDAQLILDESYNRQVKLEQLGL